MRSDYNKPTIEFEDYQLNTAIASGCSQIINLGPGDATHEMCSGYGDAWVEGFFGAPVEMNDAEVSFYVDDDDAGTKGSCSCYLSAGGETLFTS